MQNTLERIKRLLSNANPIQRIAIGAGVVAIIASALLLITSGGQGVTLSPLYTDLSEGDAASVVSELDTQGVSYELKDGGATIMIPKDDVYRTRLSLSEKGLPKNNEGYALLDKQGITTSEFRTRTAYQRALEGEIARTIGEIQGVEMAVVHLALPPQSSFVDDAGNPTASVLVRTAKTLSESQISSIVYLVSSSVRDMSPEDVTLADANGVMLHAPGSAGLAASSGSGKEAEFEANLSASISQLITRVAGPGRAAVQVNVTLNMDQVKSVSESYSKPEGSGDANTGLIDTESSSGEEYNGVTPNSSSAVLGPDGAPVAGNNQNATTDYTKDNAQRDYVYDRVVEEVNAAPGEIERLSVAVAVDDQAVDSATIEQIENLVVAAAGIDEKRGDQVVVTRMPFAQADDELAAAQKEAAAQESQGELFALIRTALVSLALALMAFFAYRSVKKARTVVVENIDVAALNLGTGSKDEDEDEESEDDETQERLNSMSQMQPEAVAQVLKTWLADPRR